jgi:dTDP-4-amino-4,6-dideoxygalactose transaminase
MRAAFGPPSPCCSVVVLPSFTFTATAAAVVWAGYRPVFADVLPDCWQLDPDALDRAMDAYGRQVAGVLGCSSFGSPPPTVVRDRWRAAVRHADVPLVLDSASAFGATDDQHRPSGGLGETEVFSFHATKPFSVGEGGAIVTADPEVAALATRLCNFGMDPGSATSDLLGLNAKCSELHAATGLAMLDRYDRVLARRRASAARVRDAIGLGVVTYQAGGHDSTWQTLQVLAPDASGRARILTRARDVGVQVRTYFDPPLHRQPAYARWFDGEELPVTDELAARAVSLPMANMLTLGQIRSIAHVAQAASPIARLVAA